VLVNLAKRGKPDALSGAVQSVSPWRRPSVSQGMAKPVRDAGGSERHAVMGWIGGHVRPYAERRLTSRGCDRTRKTKHTVHRGSVYKGESMELQASSGLTTRRWHQVNWAAGHRRVRSLQRRIVQAVQAGAWRKVKRLSSLLVHAFAARALAVKRVTENTGTKTPGGDNDLWDTPEKKATAIDRRGQWRGYRPRPLKRLSIPKKNGTQRPLSIPPMGDRARQAISRQALQPIAETTADPHSYGVRPKRRCADAIDQCVQVLRQHTAATGILEGDIAGFFDHIALAWLETPSPMPKRILSTWLRSGLSDRGAVFPTTAGVPQGGIISPVSSHMVLAGLEGVGHGGHWHRRVHQLHDVRWAEDFIVTANSREVVENTILPAVHAFFAARGVRLSPHKTIMTPLSQGCDFLGQTIRKQARSNGKPAKLQITPSKARVQTITAKVTTLCQQAAGATPAQLIETLNPIIRGWANSHRHIICGETCAQLDSFVWRRLYRWAKLRHPHNTGRWIAQRYFPHQPGDAWRCTEPTTGQQIIRIQEAVKPQRHMKVKSNANPFDPHWEAYFQYRDRQLALKTSSAFRAKRLHQQTGRCPICRQVIQCEEPLALHHRDGIHQNNQRENLVLLHPNGQRQVHYAPDSTTTVPRPSRGVGHA
jgi:RNA-directed DNA polymerase